MSTRGRDALLVGLGALLVRVPAFFAPRNLGFDDGQFGASVIAMRHGGVPYREVFSSQGPLFLALAWLGDLVTFRTVDSPRTLTVCSGAALAALVYLTGREVTSRAGALLAAGLVALSGSVLWTTGPLTSDGPAAVLATGAVLVAFVYRRRPSTGRALAIGLLAGAAISVKSLLVLPALAAAGLVVLASRRWRDVAAVFAAAAGVVLVAALPWGLGRVYEQSVQYHTDHAADRAIGANFAKSLTTLAARDAPLLAAALVAATLGIWWWTRERPRRGRAHRSTLACLTGGAAPIVLWLGLVVLVVLGEAPMWRNHVAHVVVPAALLVGVACARPKTAAIAAIAALVVLPWSAAQLTELWWPRGFDDHTAAALDRLRGLPPGALAISDDPGLVWRAGRRTPDNFVDVSILRITSPTRSLRIAEDDVVRAASSPDVCAVVRWSSRRFARFEQLGPRLRREGYLPALERPHSPRKLWIKAGCDPPR